MPENRENFTPGQRWISESEPELGLGTIVRVEDRTVTAEFKASGETRVYARKNAPLRRARFRTGDTIRDHKEKPLVVSAIEERDGLIYYAGGKSVLCETALSDSIGFNQPEERFFAGHHDIPILFDLRLAALNLDHRRRRSAVRGFIGGRIDLILHQLYIASEVSGRPAPRVLLADETGLGKTIEACLILHRLILTGRVQRAIILVPESLVHQWFVELLRRFNLWFNIYDEERCASLENANPEANPFQDDQLILCPIGLGAQDSKRSTQMQEAGWDMLIVDEAHHLRWTPDAASPEYALVDAIGQKTAGVLLLTATPEQLGVESHFARLRLLDPARFYDLNAFIAESDGYRESAILAAKLLDSQPVTEDEQAALKEELDAMLDRHGVGRVRFRNTRHAITGFPLRMPQLIPLEAPPDADALFEDLAEEFAEDALPENVEHGNRGRDARASGEEPLDPRIDCLVKLLRTIEPEKVLVICSTESKVLDIEATLRRRIHIKLAVFHEGLTLIQRDRNAAWFADRDGARLLISSEIGGEGRNFQFARHLFLFDLPLDPELLEQRIGRLDRIGQASEIQIHVPFVRGSAHEVLARWHHEGLNAFERNLSGARELYERLGPRVFDLAAEFHENDSAAADLEQLLTETVAAREDVTARLAAGRDRLMELQSFRPQAAKDLATAIQHEDDDRALDTFMLSVFDRNAIDVEEIAPRTYRLGSAGTLADSFPGLPADGFSVTRDRRRALAREDIQFLTWDHPLATGALDLILGAEKGNSSFALWPDKRVSAHYLEAVYVLECVVPPALHADRFLPPTPIRTIVDENGKDVGVTVTTDAMAGKLRPGDAEDFDEELLTSLLGRTAKIANAAMPPIVAAARKALQQGLDREIRRLEELRKINLSVRAEEIDLLRKERQELDNFVAAARLRLDAIRLIHRGRS